MPLNDVFLDPNIPGIESPTFNNAAADYSPAQQYLDEGRQAAQAAQVDYDLTTYPSTVDLPTQSNYGELVKGTIRGWTQLKGLGASSVALLGDILGADTLRDWGWDTYKEEMAAAEKYAPEIARVEDVNSPGSFISWLAGVAGEQVPQLLLSVVSYGATGIGSRLALKSFAKAFIEEKVAAGVPRNIAAAQALKAYAKKITVASAVGGTVLPTAAQETGGMYASDVEKYGIENVPDQDKVTAILGGLVSGTLELGGIEAGILNSNIIRKLMGRNVTAATERGIAKSMARDIFKTATEEGATELGQELVSIAHDHGLDLTEDDKSAMLNSLAAGAALGGLFGGASGFVTGLKNRNAARNKVEADRNKAATGDPNKSVEQSIKEAGDAIDAANAVATQAKQSAASKGSTPVSADTRAAASSSPAAMSMLDELNNIEFQINSLNQQSTQGAIQPWEAAVEITKLRDQRAELVKVLEAESKKAAKKNIAYIQASEKGQKRGPERILWENTQAERLDAFATSVNSNIEQALNNPVRDINNSAVTSRVRNQLASQVAELAARITRTEPGEYWRTETAIDEFINTFNSTQKKQQKASEKSDLDAKILAEEQALVVQPAVSRIKNDSKLRTFLKNKAKAQAEAKARREKAAARTSAAAADLRTRLAALRSERAAEDMGMRDTTLPTVSGQTVPFSSRGELGAAGATPENQYTRYEQTPTGYVPVVEPTTVVGQEQGQESYVTPNPNEELRDDTAYPYNRNEPMGQQELTTKWEPKKKPTLVSVEPVPSLDKIRKKKVVPKTPVEKVHAWIKNTLNKLPSVRQNVIVVRDHTDERLPDGARKVAKHAKAVFVTQYGRIFLIASNLSGKQDAVRALIHEAVGHYGLRTLFTETELNTFLNLVYESYKNTDSFRKLIKNDSRYRDLTTVQQAEEYVAKIAEQQRLRKKLSQNEKKLWARFKQFMNKVFKKLGMLKITDKDLKDVISASIFNLAKDDAGASYKEEYTTDKQVLDVRASSMGGSFMERTGIAATVGFGKSALADFKKTFGEYADKELGKVREETMLDRFGAMFQDTMRRMKIVQRGLKELGRTISEETNVYKIEEASHNITNGMLEDFEKDYLTGEDGLIELVAKSVEENESFEEALDKVAILAYARHAPERNESIYTRSKGEIDNGSGMTDAEAAAIIKQYGTPARQKAVDKLMEINKYRLELIEKYQLVPPDVLQEWKDTYQQYVPLKGWDEAAETILPKYVLSSKGVSVGAWTPSDFAKGRTSLAANPLVHSIKQVEDVIKMANRNEVGRAVLKLVEENKDMKSLWELDSERKYGYYLAYNKKDGTLEKVRSSSKFARENSDQIISVIDKEGHHRKILIKDIPLAKALRGLDIQHASKFINGLNVFMRFLAQLCTTWNVDFWFTNPIRDAMAASLNIGEEKYSANKFKIPEGIRRKFFTDFLQSQRAVFNAITGRESTNEYSRWFEIYKDYGGYTQLYDLKSFEGMYKKLKKEVVLAGNQRWTGKATRAARVGMDYIEAMSTSFENATRLVAFKTVAESYIDQGMPKETAYKRAASIALNLTVNFTRKGNMTPALGAMYLFFNATMQSNARLIKTLFKNPKYGASIAASMVLGSFMFAMMSDFIGGDDDDGMSYYEKVPSWERDSNLVIMSPGGGYFKLPMAYGFNILHTLGQTLYDAYKSVSRGGAANIPNIVGNGTARMFKSAFDNFVPMGSYEEGITMFMPTMLRPWAQVYLNKNYFGKPIYPEVKTYHKGEYPDNQKYWDDVEWASRQLTDMLAIGGSKYKKGFIDISPESMDHIFASYLGGAGQTVQRLLGIMSNLAYGTPQFIDVTREVPLLRRFIGVSGGGYTDSAIYNEKKVGIEVAQQLLKDAQKNHPEEVADIKKKYARELALSAQFNSVQKRLRKLGQRENKLRDDYYHLDRISYKTYFERKEVLDKKKEKLLEDFLRKVTQAGL